MKLRFGTGGAPLSSPSRSLDDGIKHVRKLGLECMELEFVQQVYLKEEKAAEVKKVAEDNDVILTCHGQYYINLNSKEKAKQEASKERIFKAAKIAGLAGAKSVTFHPGFFQGMDPEQVYQTIKKNFKEVQDRVKADNNKIELRPETTGKPTQFGSLKELTRLGQELGIKPCVDFAHLHAREGKQNTKSEFHKTLEILEKELDCIKDMHIHMSGINYGPKGEKNHLLLEESDFNWKDLLKTWKEFDMKGVVQCESPDMEKDALLMKKFYESL